MAKFKTITVFPQTINSLIKTNQKDDKKMNDSEIQIGKIQSWQCMCTFIPSDEKLNIFHLYESTSFEFFSDTLQILHSRYIQ